MRPKRKSRHLPSKDGLHIFDREFAGCGTRGDWVVERELPAWKDVEARRSEKLCGLKAW